MSYPLPSNALTVGSGNPPADMDKIVNALKAWASRVI